MEKNRLSRVFVDTLFVVALVNRRDQYHSLALDLANRYENESLLTTEGVLLEIGNALARNFKQQAIEIIREFKLSKEIEVVRITPSLFDRGLALFEAHQDKTWGLIDCMSFVAMKDARIEQALTFDRHFSQAGFIPLMRDKA